MITAMIKGIVICMAIYISFLHRATLCTMMRILAESYGSEPEKGCISIVQLRSWASLFSLRISQVRPRKFRFSRMVKKDNDPIENVITSGQWIKRKINEMVRLCASAKQTQFRLILETSLRAGSIAINYFDYARKSVPHADVFLTIGCTCFVLFALRRGTRRVRTATDIPSNYLRPGHKTILKGYVLSVNDSDNLRFYHQRLFSIPGLPKVTKQDIKFETINVRLAGIDAPEIGHFGGISQPYAEEAKKWLTNFVHNRSATIVPHRLDQYSRLVASVFVRRWFFFKYNVSLAMVQAGYATVYTNAGAEYGDAKEKLISAEAHAKKRRLGMWRQSAADYVSPSEYKKNNRGLRF